MYGYSQNCSDYLTVYKTGIQYPWKYDIQSKSAIFFAGKSSRLNIICNAGKDYRVTFLVSSQIMDNINIKVTDATGKVYFSTGIDEELINALKSKKEMLVSLENQALKVKAGNKKIELQTNINNLKLEISKYEEEIEAKRYKPNTYFEFTAMSTTELVIQVSADEKCEGRGCVGVLISNRPSYKSEF
jgi:deoxyxylulose-5-phosphate synthase